MTSTISQERQHSVKIDQERQSYEQFRLKDLAVWQAVALHKFRGGQRVNELRGGESDRDMPKGKHQKAIKFVPVTGGSQIVYKGGWSNGLVGVESVHVGARIFLLAELSSGFGQLVFGKKKRCR